MSTYYRPTKKLKVKDVKSINYFDIKKCFGKYEGHDYFLEFEGHYLHFDVNKGNIIDLYRYGGNNAHKILDEITHHLGVYFVDEYDEDYQDYAEDETKVMTITFDEENLNEKIQNKN